MGQSNLFKDSKIYLGVDVGSVSVKVVAIGDAANRTLFEKIRENETGISIFHLEQIQTSLKDFYLLNTGYTRTHGEPIRKTFDILYQLQNYLTPPMIGGIRITGSGAGPIAEALQIKKENEFKTLAQSVGLLYPEVTTILEIGGATSKFLTISGNGANGDVRILDYGKNGDCAAGTGVFMDQQASRLLYRIEEVGDVVLGADTSATIAGRCSVFAKSDMIHAQQKGYQPPQILRGLCEAVIRNFKGAIIKGKAMGEKIAFVGGVAGNKGAVQAVKEVFDIQDSRLIVPELHAFLPAIGAAFVAAKDGEPAAASLFPLPEIPEHTQREFPRTQPISMEKVVLLRDRTTQFTFDGKSLPVDAYLGVDVGSVSTKLVLIDDAGDLIKEIYTRTDARPIEIVSNGLKTIGEELGDKVKICGVGTTGSGRELIGQLIGADTINDEITAHKTGATHISEKLLDKKVDTIFDIGGQDAKYIAIENDIVVDFTMNEACAAGTGSFLEEQAERLGINVIGEFSKLALGAKSPINLGERCTVFMEKVLTPYLHEGAQKDDLIAGLAYSIVANYLNRVVRGRHIGEVIYFQGGTAYNDSVAAAFSTVLGKEIIVPPYNGVLGAVGAALIARNKARQSTGESRFRGFALDAVDYQLRNFTCKGCSNFCDIQEFTVAGEKSYWGDKCSDRYRKARKRAQEPVIPDLVKFRDELMAPFYESNGTGPTLGVPRSMYFHERLAFWSTFLKHLDFKLVFSDKTNKAIANKGVSAAVAEPCFPILVAHGHFQDLVDKQVDFIFQPNEINRENQNPKLEAFLCPWGQTQPFVFKMVPAFKPYREKIIAPTLRFRQGKGEIKHVLRQTFKPMGKSSKLVNEAVDLAYQAQDQFEQQLRQKGNEALALLEKHIAAGIVLVGRPYNIYDSAISLNLPVKLRDYYGINVIPLDFLTLHGIDINDINDSMFWNLGYKIIQAGKFVRDHANLHVIYLTNFKCGPDSYVKHYIYDASQKPYLVLQVDGHSNDAGMMTRCEAYLDSKNLI